MSLVALRRTGGETVYGQIARLLKEEIAAFYASGESLPPEHELAARFGVNRHTVRRAIELLPVLRVKSVNVSERDGTPLEYALTRFRADRIQLRIHP